METIAKTYRSAHINIGMNVLILTPDRVGSSFLQRVITIYMNAHRYDKNVINCHELVDGHLYKYYNPIFNQEVLSYDYNHGHNRENLGKHQTLPEIIDLLETADHFKVCRLTWFDLQQRMKDTESERIEFYNYLNSNFYIINGCRRNLFEYALSWCIAKESRTMNVYSPQQKTERFSKIYQDRIHVDPEIFVHHLYQYLEYCQWASRCMKTAASFYYDEHISDIDKFVSGLNIFGGQEVKTWQEIFGIDFKSWNLCHYLSSDISGIGKQLEGSSTRLLEAESRSPLDLDLVPTPLSDVPQSLTLADQQFLLAHGERYVESLREIDAMVDCKIIPNSVPIKLQTFLEKRLLIKNFEEIVDVFNEIISDPHRPLLYKRCDLLDLQEIDRQIQNDYANWHTSPMVANQTRKTALTAPG